MELGWLKVGNAVARVYGSWKLKMTAHAHCLAVERDWERGQEGT